jgi:hypothetical protein
VGKIDSAHSAASQQAVNLIGPNALELHTLFPAAPLLALVRRHAPFFRLTAIQQQTDFFEHCLVAASRRKQILALFLRSFEYLGKDCLDLE